MELKLITQALLTFSDCRWHDETRSSPTYCTTSGSPPSTYSSLHNDGSRLIRGEIVYTADCGPVYIPVDGVSPGGCVCRVLKLMELIGGGAV